MQFYEALTLSFLTLPASHLFHQGLHNCDIYYISAVNYDPAATDLIFIRVNIYPGQGEGDLQLITEPVYFIRVTIYPAAFPHNISRGHYYPGGWGEGAYC
jgi:hypothetical protein